MDRPTPTEVIASWIPHDARWHEQARMAASQGLDPLRSYITGLVMRYEDAREPLVQEYDRRTINSVREDLGVLGLSDVDWRRVQNALLL